MHYISANYPNNALLWCNFMLLFLHPLNNNIVRQKVRHILVLTNADHLFAFYVAHDRLVQCYDFGKVFKNKTPIMETLRYNLGCNH